MENFKIFLFLEGDDDERFFKKILINRFREKCNRVQIVKYAQMSHNGIIKLLKTIKYKENWDYIFLSDINSAECYPNKKSLIETRFEYIEIEKIVIVIMEIESWYLAGINNDFLRSINANLMDQGCNHVDKERFNLLIPQDMPRVLFMNKILDNYNIDLALENNESFEHFLRTFLD
ncbi:MAG: hypothetical protein GF353_02770 [Candidatus Lokiarchaeota archaeon]|nr:hypothetical protein [Candidatus Lokiarchaeota archaeon]